MNVEKIESLLQTPLTQGSYTNHGMFVQKAEIELSSKSNKHVAIIGSRIIGVLIGLLCFRHENINMLEFSGSVYDDIIKFTI